MDTKYRQIVCLLRSSESDSLYWAIPMGKLNHRDAKQHKRLNYYILAVENSKNDSFRQHITSIKHYFLDELQQSVDVKDDEPVDIAKPDTIE